MKSGTLEKAEGARGWNRHSSRPPRLGCYFERMAAWLEEARQEAAHPTASDVGDVNVRHIDVWLFRVWREQEGERNEEGKAREPKYIPRSG